MYNSGKTITQIADELGKARSTVRYHLQKDGVYVHPKDKKEDVEAKK
jgi:predicted transcriptional regulator